MSLQENGAPAPKAKKIKRGAATAPAADIAAPPFPTAAPTGIRLIPLEDLRESPTNPRKTFDAAALEELAKSVKRHGVLEPVLVRELADPLGTDRRGEGRRRGDRGREAGDEGREEEVMPAGLRSFAAHRLRTVLSPRERELLTQLKAGKTR